VASENFDALTPPALPAGWTFTGTWTTVTDFAQSAPNSVKATSNLAAVSSAVYNTAAGSADTTTAVSFLFASGTVPANFEAILLGRWTGTGFADDGYHADANLGASEIPPGIVLFKRASGSNTQLGSAVNPTGGDAFAQGVWYRLSALVRRHHHQRPGSAALGLQVFDERGGVERHPPGLHQRHRLDLFRRGPGRLRPVRRVGHRRAAVR
jgi:hypothetical protein